MQLLILDFIARRWWVFLGIFAFAVLGASLGILFVFTPFVIVALAIDQQQGWLRAVNGLPLSRRSQATASWFVGVLFPAFTATLGLIVGALIFQFTSGPQLISLPDAPTYTLVLSPQYFAPWFSVAVGASFGLGYAALCFLLVFVLPTRVQGKLLLLCLALFTLLAQFGPMFISFILPKNPGMMVTWHWVALATVPIWVLLSWQAAPCIFGGRVVSRQSAGRETRPNRSLGCSRGLTGLKLFLTDTMPVILLVPLSTCAVSIIDNLWRSDFHMPIITPSASAMLLVSCGFLCNYAYDLRILRCLPLSTSRLALLLMVGPITCGLCYVLIISVFCRCDIATITPTLWLFTLFFSLSGGSALVLACWSQFALWKFVPVAGFSFLLIMIASFDFLSPMIAPVVLCVGAAALLLSYYFFKRGLRKSKTYQTLRGVKALEAT